MVSWLMSGGVGGLEVHFPSRNRENIAKSVFVHFAVLGPGTMKTKKKPAFPPERGHGAWLRPSGHPGADSASPVLAYVGLLLACGPCFVVPWGAQVRFPPLSRLPSRNRENIAKSVFVRPLCRFRSRNHENEAKTHIFTVARPWCVAASVRPPESRLGKSRSRVLWPSPGMWPMFRGSLGCASPFSSTFSFTVTEPRKTSRSPFSSTLPF